MKKIALTLSLVVLVGSFGGLIGCQSTTIKSTDPNSSIGDSMPALQPETHMGRFADGGASMCYGCHGAGELANPMLNGATIVPEDHYVDAAYASKTFDDGHGQCNTCHAES